MVSGRDIKKAVSGIGVEVSGQRKTSSMKTKQIALLKHGRRQDAVTAASTTLHRICTTLIIIATALTVVQGWEKVKRMDDFDKWVCGIVTVLVAVIVWGVIMISLVTFRWLGVL